MPVRQYSPVRPPSYDQLVDGLATEWGTPNMTATEPAILEEKDARGELAHIYVVWSDWADLDRQTRGEIIMDAAERVKPKDEVLKITIAMGLTPNEADRM